MKSDKLTEIIERKNQRLEDQAVATAEQLINEILTLQNAMAEAQSRIVECQAELKKLEVQTVDPAKILGE